MTRADWDALYRACLATAITEHPGEYGPDALANLDRTVARMGAAMDRGSAGLTSSPSYRRLARRLGIPYTVTALMAARKACTP